MTEEERWQIAAQRASRANGGRGPSDGGMGVEMRAAASRAEREAFLALADDREGGR